MVSPIITSSDLEAAVSARMASRRSGFGFGRGTESEPAEAVTWYRQAAQQGHAAAQYILARLYLHGEGVPANDAEAAKWIRLAAEQGMAEAQLDLAHFYLHGRGVPEDYVLAYVWFNRASSSGVAAAEDLKRRIKRLMTEDQIAQAQELVRGQLAA